jgi:hypothetical protein
VAEWGPGKNFPRHQRGLSWRPECLEYEKKIHIYLSFTSLLGLQFLRCRLTVRQHAGTSRGSLEWGSHSKGRTRSQIGRLLGFQRRLHGDRQRYEQEARSTCGCHGDHRPYHWYQPSKGFPLLFKEVASTDSTYGRTM